MGYQVILDDISSGEYSLDQLREIISEVSVSPNDAVQGATTILYSGEMPDGTHTGTLAEAISDAFSCNPQKKQPRRNGRG